MATYLDDIVAHHRARAAHDTRPIDELEKAVAAAPAVRPFRDALTARLSAHSIVVIAEVKRRSPSAGALALELDPTSLAWAYASGGASCLSVLTDGPHFGGSAADSVAARTASGLPVLRKDFTVSPADLYDARAMGADAALLIVAALSDGELARFIDLGHRLGLTLLVEVHDEDELQRGLDAGAVVIGVNQRDLRTFTIDARRALRLVEQIPSAISKVAESGLRSPHDAAQLASAGYDAVLVGETFVTAVDPAAAVAAFASARGRAGGRGPTMFVKICGITNEQDALVAVAMGADAVGFIFAPSVRQVAAGAIASIVRRLPPEILTVGVFRDSLPQRVVDVVHQAGLRAAQLHGRETPEEVAYVAERIPLVIKAFSAGARPMVDFGAYRADAFLIDAPDPGSGQVFDWRLAEGMPRSRRLILGGGLTADNVADAVRLVHPWGVDVSSGVERAPGKKDARLVRSFIQAARAAEPDPYESAEQHAPYDWQEEW